MTDVDSIAGRRALVTGASRGLGAAVAAALSSAGADVVVLARDGSRLEKVAAEVQGRAVVADVADPAAVDGAVAEIGDVDVVVANAGVVWPLGRFLETDPDEWAQAVAVNLVGAMRVVRATAPAMVRQGWGRVITISSGAADPPGMPSANAYSVSKAALDMFTVHLAHELDGTGVTVNAVRPGVVDTEMQDFMRSMPRERVGDAFHERFHGLHERGELIAADEAAGFVVDVIRSARTGAVLDIRRDR